MSLLQLFTATDAAPYAWSLVLSGGYVVASILPLGAARSAANFEMKDMAAPAALQTGTLPATAVVAAFAHPVLRLAYIAAYVGNIPPARGLCWASGLLCSGILYSEGLKALLIG